MSLSYYFSFCAPGTTSAVELENFFRVLEKEAQALGFQPTLVLNAVFDTDERRKFARQLTHGLMIESATLTVGAKVLMEPLEVIQHALPFELRT